MHLTSLSIANFRGFFANQTINFSKPSAGKIGSGLTVLVGQNNSGKSAVLDCFTKFLETELIEVEGEERHRRKISIVFKAGRGSRTITGTDSASVIVTDDNFLLSRNRFKHLSSRRQWAPYISGGGGDNPDQYWQQIKKWGKTGIDSWFVSRIVAISADVVEKSKLNEILKELLPNLSKWETDIHQGQRYIRYQSLDNGTWHSANVIGDGVISLFRIAVALYDLRPDDILVIDEPELSLHPQAQKRLAIKLAQKAATNQVIIVTHSPHFIRWQDVKNGAAIYRLSKGTDGKCRIYSLSDTTKATLDRLAVDFYKPHQLDAVAKEIFFCEGVVFVEGQEDVALITKFVIEENMVMPELFGYGAGGAGNIIAMLQMAKDLGIKAAAVYDGDQAALANTARLQFPEFQIHVLPADDIRVKVAGTSTTRAKTGIFASDGTILPTHKPAFVTLCEELAQI